MSGCKIILGIETKEVVPADLELRWRPDPGDNKLGATWLDIGFTSLNFILYSNGNVGYEWVTSPRVRGNHSLGGHSGLSTKLVLPESTVDQVVFTSDVLPPDHLVPQEGDFRGMCGNIYERGLLLTHPNLGSLSVLLEEKASEPFPRSEPTV